MQENPAPASLKLCCPMRSSSVEISYHITPLSLKSLPEIKKIPLKTSLHFPGTITICKHRSKFLTCNLTGMEGGQMVQIWNVLEFDFLEGRIVHVETESFCIIRQRKIMRILRWSKMQAKWLGSHLLISNIQTSLPASSNTTWDSCLVKKNLTIVIKSPLCFSSRS